MSKIRMGGLEENAIAYMKFACFGSTLTPCRSNGGSDGLRNFRYATTEEIQRKQYLILQRCPRSNVYSGQSWDRSLGSLQSARMKNFSNNLCFGCSRGTDCFRSWGISSARALELRMDSTSLLVHFAGFSEIMFISDLFSALMTGSL